jgi:arylsulfatase A-like enzyme
MVFMSERPHLIIIMADQLRFDAVGEYTPNINRLREESVEFERVYCASPLCVPARGAFFTGKYPSVNGSLINHQRGEPDSGQSLVRPENPHLYGLLERDWDSWHVGKQHLFATPKPENAPDSTTHWLTLEGRHRQYLQTNGKREPGGPSFKGSVPELASGRITRKKSYSIPKTGRYEGGFDDFTDGFIVNDALHAIRQRDTGKPFLLNAMFHAPHPPFDIPEPWFSKVKKADLPENVGVWCGNQSPLQLYNLTGALGTRYTREDWQSIWPVYLGLVSLLDDCVGMIVDELKKQGMYDDSLIIFTSDHGEMLGSHGLWQKMCMYEESVRTPLFMKFPASYRPAVRRTNALASAVDVLPTILDFLGLEAPENLSGISLMPLVEGNRLDRRRVYIQYDGNGGLSNFQRCVVQGEWKLIVDMFKDEVFIELYNVDRDPQEKNNLAFDNVTHGHLIDEMLICLRKHMEETKDHLNIAEDAYERFIRDYSPFKV